MSSEKKEDPFEFPIKRCRGSEFPVCEYTVCCPKKDKNITTSEYHESCDNESYEFSINFENEEDYMVPEDETNLLYVKGYPFYKPTKRETSPRFTLYQNFTKANYCATVPVRKWLTPIIRKENWSRQTQEVCIAMLTEIREFCDEMATSIPQGLSILEIFYNCFKFFKLGPAITLDDFSEYFRQTLLLYVVRNIPDSFDIFSPMQCLSIAKKFFDVFESNFTVLQYLLVPEITVHISIE